jgi:hypothetical protein
LPADPAGPTPVSPSDLDVLGAFDGETITRRLVTTGANVAGALATAAIVVPALGFALGPLGMRAKVTWQAIGPPDALSEDTFVARTITFAPDLGSLGKTTVFARRRNRRLDTEPGDRSPRDALTLCRGLERMPSTGRSPRDWIVCLERLACASSLRLLGSLGRS